jgi:DNA invertase Pin-like site-specific DNA recombinase
LGAAVAGRDDLRPDRPDGEDVFNISATFAKHEVDPLRMRARRGMAVARAKGRLWGRQLKLSALRQARLAGLHAAGEHAVADLAGLFSVSWPAVYRVLERVGGRPAAGSGAEGRQHRG